MFRDQRIGVVVRADNEERQNEMVLRTTPDFVDSIGSWRVEDVPIEPRYGIGEKSSMRIIKVIPDISGQLIRGFLARMFEKS